MADMLVNLYNMPEIDESERLRENKVTIKRAMALDKEPILEFVRKNFHDNWVGECEKAILNQPASCYIAVHDEKIVGFACYDATALGVFGPTGVIEHMRGRGIARALLGRCLTSMKEKGYAYAVIGWAIEGFYEKAVNATIIEDSPTTKSVYSNLITP